MKKLFKKLFGLYQVETLEEVWLRFALNELQSMGYLTQEPSIFFSKR